MSEGPALVVVALEWENIRTQKGVIGVLTGGSSRVTGFSKRPASVRESSVTVSVLDVLWKAMN